MYRYLLFTYSHYYPAGGMEDCIFKTNSFEEIKTFIESNRVHISSDNCNVYDAKDDRLIEMILE